LLSIVRLVVKELARCAISDYRQRCMPARISRKGHSTKVTT